MPRRVDAIDVRVGVIPENGSRLYDLLGSANPRSRGKLLVHLASLGALVEEGNFQSTLTHQETPSRSSDLIESRQKRRKVDVVGDDEGCAP